MGMEMETIQGPEKEKEKEKKMRRKILKQGEDSLADG